MPANKRPRRLNYAVNKKRSVKWLKNALAVVTVKLNKYKININKI